MSPEDADITIELVDHIGTCGYETVINEYLGCATGSSEFEIGTGMNDVRFRNTAIHELGHNLGPKHDDSPRWIMSVGDSGGPVANATERQNPWNETETLTFSVGGSIKDRSQVTSELEDAVSFYNTNDHRLPGDLEVKVIGSPPPQKANVIIQNSSESSYGSPRRKPRASARG